MFVTKDNNLVQQLVDGTVACFDKMNLTEHTLNVYQRILQNFVDYAKRKQSADLTASLCRSFLQEEYGFEMYSIGLPQRHTMKRRPILALLEFQNYGYVLRGKHPTKDLNAALPMECVESVNSFLETVKDQNAAESTLYNKTILLRSFTEYLIRNNVNCLNDVGIQTINDFAVYLTGYSKAHIYNYFTVIRQWMRHALKNGEISNDITPYFPVITLPSRLKIPTAYSEDEIKRLLATVDRGNPLGKRTYAMFLLGVRYGLRSSDVRELKMSNLLFDECKIVLTQRKTGKEISFDMLPDVGWALIDYLKNGRPLSKTDYVFVSHKVPYGPFAENNHLWQLFNKHLQLAGFCRESLIVSVGFHTLHHSLAGNMLQNDVPLTVIKEVLGHENLHTTTAYTKIDVPQLRQCALEVPL